MASPATTMRINMTRVMLRLFICKPPIPLPEGTARHLRPALDEDPATDNYAPAAVPVQLTGRASCREWRDVATRPPHLSTPSATHRRRGRCRPGRPQRRAGAGRLP